MGIYKKILFLSVLVCSAVNGYQVTLGDGLCSLSELTTKKTCVERTLEFANQYPVFYILVHGTFSSAQKFIGKIAWEDTPAETVPEHFFQQNQYNGQTPIRLVFNWTGALNDKARHTAGNQLALILDSLHEQCGQQGIVPKVILLAHSHGGNVIAVASNRVKNPIDIAIFIGTPILRFDAKEIQKSENLLYLPARIKQLFSFYSMQDFVQAGGAGATSFKRRYAPIAGIDLYNIRLFVSGQEPLHRGQYNTVVERHVLQAIQRIKEYFKKNKNIAINIDPSDQEANYLVAIKTYAPEKSSQFTGTPTDSLWPDWTKFTYSPEEIDEATLSDNMKKIFKEVYKKEFTDTATLTDRTVRTLQEAQCTMVVGPLGSGLAELPLAAREAAKKYCCEFTSFSRLHRRASAAIACDMITTPQTLTQQDIDIVCNFVFGNAGRLLAVLPPAVRQDMNKRCCSARDFSTTHPQAAKALKCPAA